MVRLHVKKIKNAAHENSNVDIMCKRAFYSAIYTNCRFHGFLVSPGAVPVELKNVHNP